MRPSWDIYFLQLLPLLWTRATCQRRKISAIIVSPDHRILSTGYNGAPPGVPHCEELGGCLRQRMGIPSGQRQEMCRAVHAEKNAILFAKADLKGCTIYISTTPCADCAKSIISVGIKKVVYTGEAYPDQLAFELLSSAGVELVKVKEG